MRPQAERRLDPRHQPGPETWASLSFEGARYSGLKIKDLSAGGALITLPLGLWGRVRPLDVLEPLVLVRPDGESLSLRGAVTRARPHEIGLQFLGLSEEIRWSLVAPAQAGSRPSPGQAPLSSPG